MSDTPRLIQERLATLDPIHIEIRDDSARHAGHEGAKQGGGHYRVLIISPRFAGCRTIERHRLIYDALGSMMRNEIHALSIRALAPDEQ